MEEKLIELHSSLYITPGHLKDCLMEFEKFPIMKAMGVEVSPLQKLALLFLRVNEKI